MAAAAKLARGHLSDGLDALSRERLQLGYGKGIDAASKALHVPRRLVADALPAHEVAEVLAEVERCQRNARGLTGQFVGALGSPLQEGTKSDSPASQHLRNIAVRYALDKHISEPVSELANAVARWEELLDRASQQLSSNPTLRSLVLRRRVVMAAVLLVALVVLGGAAAAGAWQHVVVLGAQNRIDALLADTDPCVAEQVDEKDLGHALEEQVQRLEGKKAECARIREREAYAASCSQLADHVEAGKFSEQDAEAAKASRALLERVATGKVTAQDLMIDATVMPCQDTPSAERLWKAFTRSVGGATELWTEAESVSDHVRSLLTAKGAGLSQEAREVLESRVEKVTKRAITMGLEPELDRARRLCLLVDRLGYEKKPWCKALDRISRQ